MNKLIFIFTVCVFFSCTNTENEKTKLKKYKCSCEIICDDQLFFCSENTDSIYFSKAELRSSDFSYKGKYSIKLDYENPFGLEVCIENVKPDTYYKVSVEKLEKFSERQGVLVITNKAEDVYQIIDYTVKTNENGWQHMETVFSVPPILKSEELYLYLWNKGEYPIYFDDFSVEEIESKEYPVFNEDALMIYIDSTEFDILKKERLSAFSNGVLENSDSSWANAIIFYGEDIFKAEIRLKGDFLDHLRDDKWSFRIKIKNNEAWRGMTTFSIQSPLSRYYLNEWVAHKIFKEEDILTPEYSFIPVFVNNKSVGLYAYEEHFEKQLLESQRRREGPILKLTEDAFWTGLKLLNNGDTVIIPFYESSKILAFNQDEIIAIPEFFQQFNIAQNLLYRYKWLIQPPGEIFDLDKIAKYYALIDLTKMYHTMQWNNQRFYYNPIISKLEPIVFDGYTEDGPYDWVHRSVFGNFSKEDLQVLDLENMLNFHQFNDSIFVSKYISYLEKYSDTSFLNNFFENYSSEINRFEGLLIEEFPYYKFDKEFYYKNAAAIQIAIDSVKNKLKNGFYSSTLLDFLDIPNYPDNFNMELPEQLVQAYLQEQNSDGCNLDIYNYITQNIFIEGIGDEKNMLYKLPEKVMVQAYYKGTSNIQLEFGAIYDYLFFSVENLDTIFSVPVFKWNAPGENVSSIELRSDMTFLQKYTNLLHHDSIIFESDMVFTDKIIIPQGFKIFFRKGITLDFIENSCFLSYSPVFMLGDENARITINSSDKTCKGFTVLQADGESMIEYTTFSNLNTFNYDGWTLTGAVNFYESDVDLCNVLITDNLCEDGINIIRSDVVVNQVEFKNIFGDALDFDFSDGTVEFCTFNNSVNDAIDFSGSIVEIKNCEILSAGDKGISCGEKSNLIVTDCSINNANIAVTSKDLSVLFISNSKFSDCVYGFVAMTKKPEYGPSEIIAENIDWQNIIKPIYIEKKSKFKLDNRIIEATETNLSLIFY